jgi:hypothetical protein
MTADAGAPVVSVVLRTYDLAPFIAQAIESVLIQDTAFPFELEATRGSLMAYLDGDDYWTSRSKPTAAR